MHDSRTIFLVDNAPLCIKAAYEADEDAKKTEFKTYDETLEVGDLVVVESRTRHGRTVVKVTDVDVEPDLDKYSDAIDWVVGRFDDTKYQQSVKNERAFLSAARKARKRAEREKLRAEMMADLPDEDIKQLTQGNNED